MADEREERGVLVTAVVPAFNEETRIAAVLETLGRARTVSEIIVVDDGSTDGTRNVVSMFSGVRYLRHQQNLGKGTALKTGVATASGDIVFFCDADLTGLDPGTVDEIINPVLSGRFDMFVGARDHRKNFLVRAFVGLEYRAGIYPTTGQRALRKEIWERLPEYYKSDFRVEVGLNNLTRGAGRGFGFKKFVYGHSKKERKFGIRRGLRVKLRMYLEVVRASLRARFVDRLSRSGGALRSGKGARV